MSFNRFAVACTAAVCLFSLAAPGVSGTTGGITVRALDATSNAPVADAAITATSPSQNATTKSDTDGHFNFISLGPDTYTVTASKTGYAAQSVPGITVISDQTRTVTIVLQRAVRTIGTVTATGTTSLVRPGTTSNVFSINAAGQKATAA